MFKKIGFIVICLWTSNMLHTIAHFFPRQISAFQRYKKALQGQELNNVAGSALLGLAKIKKQLPSRFRSSLGCMRAAWFAGCSKLLCVWQDAQSSFFAGCFMLLSFQCRMLQAPFLQDASWLLMCPSWQVMFATLLTFDVTLVEVVWVLPSGR